MIRRILGKRRPTLVGISLEEELALLRVELMYGLRVSREAYLRRKMDEREELSRRLHGRDPEELLSELRGCLERVVHPASLNSAPVPAQSAGKVVDLRSHRRARQAEDPEPA
ncbi:hypothetical protein [Nonomuraea sp. NPDC050310]|uniref:hypothetical protein n=1 Tax=unclassified Nonomuraea TaxID=2593643 RepID=UPI0033C0042A